MQRGAHFGRQARVLERFMQAALVGDKDARILNRFMQAALVGDKGLSGDPKQPGEGALDEDLDSEIQAVEQMRGQDGRRALSAKAVEFGVRLREHKNLNVDKREVRCAPDEGVGQVEVAALARSLLACRQLLWAKAVAL